MKSVPPLISAEHCSHNSSLLEQPPSVRYFLQCSLTCSQPIRHHPLEHFPQEMFWHWLLMTHPLLSPFSLPRAATAPLKLLRHGHCCLHDKQLITAPCSPGLPSAERPCHTPGCWDQRVISLPSVGNSYLHFHWSPAGSALLSVTSGFYHCHCLLTSLLPLTANHSLFTPEQPGEPLRLSALHGPAQHLPGLSHQTGHFCGLLVTRPCVRCHRPSVTSSPVLSLIPYSHHSGTLLIPQHRTCSCLCLVLCPCLWYQAPHLPQSSQVLVQISPL